MKLYQEFRKPELPAKILPFIQGKEFPTVSDISLSFSVPYSNARWYVKKLVQYGFVERKKIGNTYVLSLSIKGKKELKKVIENGKNRENSLP